MPGFGVFTPLETHFDGNGELVGQTAHFLPGSLGGLAQFIFPALALLTRADRMRVNVRPGFAHQCIDGFRRGAGSEPGGNHFWVSKGRIVRGASQAFSGALEETFGVINTSHDF